MAIGNNDKILIVGGDDRLVHLTAIFKDKGYMVSTYGHEKAENKDITEHKTLEEGIADSNIIIGPIPFNTGDKLNMKLSDKTVSLGSLVNLLKTDKKLFLGSPDGYFADLAQRFNIEYLDYNKFEAFQTANAAITAEGTVAMIINERNTTICGSHILILGYGRIGKMLSHYLKVFEPKLYVAARKQSDITWAKLMGCEGIMMDQLDEILGSMDIIINTVPACILSNAAVDIIPGDALIIDLASKPGGLDHVYAAQKGIKTIHALGLPGKVTPKSAAKAIFETILITGLTRPKNPASIGGY